MAAVLAGELDHDALRGHERLRAKTCGWVPSGIIRGKELGGEGARLLAGRSWKNIGGISGGEEGVGVATLDELEQLFSELKEVVPRQPEEPVTPPSPQPAGVVVATEAMGEGFGGRVSSRSVGGRS